MDYRLELNWCNTVQGLANFGELEKEAQVKDLGIY